MHSNDSVLLKYMSIGSLTKKGKYYYAVFYINGKQKWLNTKIEAKPGNKKKAEAAKDEIIKNYKDSLNPNGEMYLVQYIRNWLDSVKYRYKPSSYEDNEKRIRIHIIPYFEPLKLTLSDLTTDHVNQFLIYLKTSGNKQTGGGLAEKTVSNTRSVLSAVLNDAVNDGFIPVNPVEKSKMPVFEDAIKEDMKVYGAEEANRLLSYAKEQGSHAYPFLMLIFHTGMRKGEAHALLWSDIDLKNKVICINKSRSGTNAKVAKKTTTPKTKKAVRRIPISEPLLEALQEEKDRQDRIKKMMGSSYEGGDYVVLNTEMKPYSNLGAINRVVNRLIEGAGLEHSTIHQFRHTVATILDSEGESLSDISVLLGHQSVSTTERNYINRIRKAKTETIASLTSAYRDAE